MLSVAFLEPLFCKRKKNKSSRLALPTGCLRHPSFMQKRIHHPHSSSSIMFTFVYVMLILPHLNELMSEFLCNNELLIPLLPGCRNLLDVLKTQHQGSTFSLEIKKKILYCYSCKAIQYPLRLNSVVLHFPDLHSHELSLYAHLRYLSSVEHLDLHFRRIHRFAVSCICHELMGYLEDLPDERVRALHINLFFHLRVHIRVRVSSKKHYAALSSPLPIQESGVLELMHNLLHDHSTHLRSYYVDQLVTCKTVRKLLCETSSGEES